MTIKNIMAVVAASAFLVVMAACSNQKSAKDQDSASAQEKVRSDADRIRDVVAKWNSSLNNRDSEKSLEVFADRVFFYTREVSGEEATRLRIDLATKDPSWHQKIVTDIEVTELGGGQFRASFTKESVSNKGTHTYPAYLYFEKIDGKWKVTQESDKVTDANLARRRAKVPADAIRGDFDGDGQIDNVWIEGKFDSDGYATTPLRLRSDNPKLEGLEWDASRGVLLFNLGDLNNSNRDFLGSIPHNDSNWCIYTVYGMKNGHWVKPVEPFNVWLGDEDLDRVGRSGRKGYVTIKYNNMSDPETAFDQTTKEVKLNW